MTRFQKQSFSMSVTHISYSVSYCISWSTTSHLVIMCLNKPCRMSWSQKQKQKKPWPIFKKIILTQKLTKLTCPNTSFSQEQIIFNGPNTKNSKKKHDDLKIQKYLAQNTHSLKRGFTPIALYHTPIINRDTLSLHPWPWLPSSFYCHVSYNNTIY